MQIRYKITVTYAVTVAVILLLLCYSVYFLSAQDRVAQFHERLKARGLTVYRLMNTKQLDSTLLRELVRAPSSALNQKSFLLYDSNFRLVFTHNDHQAAPPPVDVDMLRRLKRNTDYYFKIGRRDALAFRTAEHTIVIAAYDDDRIQWLSQLRMILLVSFFASVALVVLVGYAFSLQLVRSVSQLSENINHISSQDLSLRLDKGESNDELAQLTATINNLLSRLQHSFETQSRFIDNASHELSTPLAVILSQLDVARQRSRTTSEYEQLVDSVYEDVSRLDLLVKSLLELAKVSGSYKGLELTYFRIDDLLMQLPVNLRKINPAYKVKLLFDDFPDDEDEMKVYGNEALLFCAFYNIVHNACKYAPDNAAVVKLAFHDHVIEVVVKDYGPGIEEQDLPHVFQPFYRSANVNAAIPGTGLGLPLANNIIKLHNGNISVQTEKGMGTTFVVTIRQKYS